MVVPPSSQSKIQRSQHPCFQRWNYSSATEIEQVRTVVMQRIACTYLYTSYINYPHPRGSRPGYPCLTEETQLHPQHKLATIFDWLANVCDQSRRYTYERPRCALGEPRAAPTPPRPIIRNKRHYKTNILAGRQTTERTKAQKKRPQKPGPPPIQKEYHTDTIISFR